MDRQTDKFFDTIYGGYVDFSFNEICYLPTRFAHRGINKMKTYLVSCSLALTSFSFSDLALPISSFNFMFRSPMFFDMSVLSDFSVLCLSRVSIRANSSRRSDSRRSSSFSSLLSWLTASLRSRARVEVSD